MDLDNATTDVATFLRDIFGTASSHLWEAHGTWDKATHRHADWQQRAYRYPDDLGQLLDVTGRAHITQNAYFCVSLTKTPDSREKSNIEFCTAVYADLDECHYSKLLLEPSYAIETSPGKFQVFWIVENPVTREEGENASKRIAYYHGIDKCWDASHFFRIPGTFNHKYPDKPIVEIVLKTGKRFRLSDFDVYPETNFGEVTKNKNGETARAERPQEVEAAQVIIERYAHPNGLPFSFPEMWAKVPDKDWSGELWHIIGMCKDAGMTPEEAYSVSLPCGSNKYQRDGRSDDELWRDVQKKYAEKPKVETPQETNIDTLTRSLADYRSKVLRWLWPGWIPLGKLTMFDGDPGLGKSVVTLDCIARVTIGKRFPQSFEIPEEPRDVIICAAEDDIEDTIKPRLMAAGADLNRIHTIVLKRDDKGNLIPLEIPRDVAKIAAAVRKHNAALVVIDPIMGYLGEEIKSYTDASVRKALSPLKEMAEETGCAVVLVRHLNKDGDLKKAIYRGGGSIAFSGAARSGIIFERHPDDKDLIIMALAKTNLAKRRDESIGYRLGSKFVEVDDGINEATIVKWEDGLYSIDADTLVSKPDARKQAPERDRAITFLGEVLSKEPMPVKQVEKLAKEESFTWSTVRDAAAAMKVRKRQVRDPETKALIEWTWALGDL